MSIGHDRIVFPLDNLASHEVVDWVYKLKGHVGIFKVGLELFTLRGPGVVQWRNEAGVEVMLDLKLHDIPNTVASATRIAVAMGVKWITVHTLAGEAALCEGCAHNKFAGEIVAWNADGKQP